jgi:hypothetical protein
MNPTSKPSSNTASTRAKAAGASRSASTAKLDPRDFDMDAFGKEICQSKETAVAFLKKAGILNKNGVLAKPYRN